MDKPHMSIIEKMSKKASKYPYSIFNKIRKTPFQKVEIQGLSLDVFMVKWAYKKKRWQDVNSL